METLAVKEVNLLNLFVKTNFIKQLFLHPGANIPRPIIGSRPLLVVKYGPPASGKGSPPHPKGHRVTQ